MRKIVKILFFVICFCLISFSQSVKNKPKDKEILEKIEESIYNLKYSQDFLKKKASMDFIFDNIERAIPIIEEYIVEEEQDLLLANLVQIVDISDKSFKTEILDKLIEKNYSKPFFISSILLYLNKRDEKERISKLFYKVFNSANNLEPKNEVLKFLRNNNISTFNKFLIDYLLNTTSFFLSQEIIKTLSSFDIEREDAKKIFKFLSSIDEGVRNAAVLFFSKYPDYTNFFIEEFGKSSDFFLKDSIIQILSYYDNPTVLSFFLDNIEEKLYQKSIIKALMNIKVERIDILKKLINFYRDNDITAKSVIINILFFKFRNMDEELRNVIISFVKDELKRAYIERDEHILYFILKSFYNLDYDDKDIEDILILIKNSNFNWIINKTVIEILDLKR